MHFNLCSGHLFPLGSEIIHLLRLRRTIIYNEGGVGFRTELLVTVQKYRRHPMAYVRMQPRITIAHCYKFESN